MGMKNRAQIEAALRAAAKKKFEKFTAGMVKAGLYIQKESQKIVPVDYGILKASAFTRLVRSSVLLDSVEVQVGYTAAYAVYVHENLDAAHGAAFNAKYAMELAHAAYLRKKKLGGTTGPFRHNRGENQQAKFLEQPFRRAQMDGTVLAIVAAEMKT